MKDTQERGWFTTPRTHCAICHKLFDEEELDENDMCDTCREEAQDRAEMEAEGILCDTIDEEAFMMEMKGDSLDYD